MNPAEYQAYKATVPPGADPDFNADMLYGPPRTLCLGYNDDRTTMHVYFFEGNIHLLHISDVTTVVDYQFGESLPAHILRPGKRAMPEYTDLEFAQIMRSLGQPLTFTQHTEPRYAPFACRRRDNLADYRNFLFESA